ncbi:DNA starvation/stationary phase protection protein Dps [Urbifossiella limnaea]|uniref:DNA protection during starvation protein n=1 Tax=Urbifossiella limnaea TaxID=2528023 RepID=A0A517XYQ8_9BACT|nr:DNA starvation/stationary phase protection protein Dps [Urbifossiella limnaea]QDU22645.1 DNA protection during starvation protein [Urbifossiella limnaea]
MPPRLFPTRHDLPADNRRDLIALLNAHVADLTDLRSQTKHAHWNVKGPTFIALHKLFDELTDTLDELTDTTAERATALGGVADGTIRAAAAQSRLPEFPSQTFAGLSVVEALAVRYADLAKSTREAIDAADTLGDAATADLFTAASRELDKALWFLESHLQG